MNVIPPPPQKKEFVKNIYMRNYYRKKEIEERRK